MGTGSDKQTLINAEGRYKRLTVHSVYGIYLCLQCGYIVADTEIHDGWHYDVEIGADEEF